MNAAPHRLQRRAEFVRVAREGRKIPMPGFVLQALARPDLGACRVGFTVTRKVGNAVVRNRTKRRLREAARLVLAGEGPAADLVLVGRAGTRTQKFAALMQDLTEALGRAGV